MGENRTGSVVGRRIEFSISPDCKTHYRRRVYSIIDDFVLLVEQGQQTRMIALTNRSRIMTTACMPPIMDNSLVNIIIQVYSRLDYKPAHSQLSNLPIVAIPVSD